MRVSAKSQAPTHTFIGVYGPIELISPEQTIELDGGPENLPSGKCTADVTFYPRWGAESGLWRTSLLAPLGMKASLFKG